MDPVVIKQQINTNIQKWNSEITDIDKKIAQLRLQMFAVPQFSQQDDCKYHKTRTITTDEHCPNGYKYISNVHKELHQNYPEAFFVSIIPSAYEPKGIYLKSHSVLLLINSEITYLYNRKLQLQKYIDKSTL